MGALVSAVIPTYNYARFVGRAIDSVLAQSHAPIECIVVDDGSTDDTPGVLARYGDRIRAIRQVNRGLSAARNAGIGAARGEYVALLDADDVWKPAKIARQLEVLERDPDLGAVGCGLELTGETAAPRAVAVRPFTPDLPARLRRVAVRDFWVEGSGSGALVPRRVFEAVGLFDEELRGAEDWDMWLRIAARFRIANVPEILVSISRHGTGTFRNADKMERAQWKVYEGAIARWPEVLDARTRRRMRALILADAGGEYLGAREYAKALERYVASLREWPLDPWRWNVVAKLALRRLRA
jgi:glycosyltransferase involved in cell wall biosynthesis